MLRCCRARIVARKSACPARAKVGAAYRGALRQSACRGAPTCPRTFVRHARFSSRRCPLGMRAYTCTCTVHDKLSFTRLQNYTIGASLMSVSVSVSVPWGSSLSERPCLRTVVALTAGSDLTTPRWGEAVRRKGQGSPKGGQSPEKFSQRYVQMFSL